MASLRFENMTRKCRKWVLSETLSTTTFLLKGFLYLNFGHNCLPLKSYVAKRNEGGGDSQPQGN